MHHFTGGNMDVEQKDVLRIGRFILALLFILTAYATSCLSAETYEAKPENVPEWAKQGMFQFIRIDGGEIESLKAERTSWGKEFSEQEKEVLSGIYDKYENKLFEKLKEASFDWIWVTWSNGWSTDAEKKNRIQLKKLITHAHEKGIRVTTYLSATNMFWESMFKDEPESFTWVRLENGKPAMYGGPLNPMRFLADPGNADWEKYIVKKAEMAIDAGADAVFFDNVIGDKEGLKKLFSRYQRMAATKASKTGNLKIPLYVNAHLEPNMLELNDICEIIWNEFGKNTPGVWPDTGWDVANVRKTRFILGAKKPWQPHKYEDDKYHCGPREKCIPTPVEQKLSIAEAWAFGSSFSRNIEGKFLKSLILGEKDGLDAWAAIAQYNKWVNEHRRIYVGAEQLARIALLAIHDGRGFSGFPDHAMAETLIRQNTMFGTQVIGRINKGKPLDGFKTLLIPAPVSEISESEKEAILKFAAEGGAVFASEPGEYELRNKEVSDFYKKLKFTPIPTSVKDMTINGQVPSEFIAEINRAAGGSLLTLENTNYVAANVTANVDRSAFYIHFINYEHNKPAENAKVKIDLTGFVKNTAGLSSATLLSPDSDGEKLLKSSCKGAVCEFSLDKIIHYSIVELK